jgi:phosphohistidine swiveling domain-containing protein
VKKITATTKQQILKRIQQLQDRYADDMIYYDYPGLLFYLGQSFPWLSTQAKEYFSTTVPFFLFFFKDGKCSFGYPYCIGPGEHVMVQLKREGILWVKNHEKKAERAEKIAEEWLKENQVMQKKTLDEYLKQLQESKKVFLKTHIHFQIAVHMDRHLKMQLFHAFKGSSLSSDTILKICTPSERSAMERHNKEVAWFQDWCSQKGIALTREAYQKNIDNQEFVKRLNTCYDIGHVLYAGFGGVRLWTVEDEYQHVCKSVVKTKEAEYPSPSLTTEQKKWIALSRYLIELRERKKILQSRFYFYQAQILGEIAKIVEIPRAELEHLHSEQFTDEFLTSHSIRNVIKEQKSGYLVFWEPLSELKVWTGDDALHAYALLESEKPADVFELRGQGACHGKAKGAVRIISNPRMQKTFHKGEILVTNMTAPDFVPLMEKAGAVVTDLGGITCHAAIVAREMGKPCVIGTRIATKVLKNGDLVEVNATKGIVKRLK